VDMLFDDLAFAAADVLRSFLVDVEEIETTSVQWKNVVRSVHIILISPLLKEVYNTIDSDWKCSICKLNGI